MNQNKNTDKIIAIWNNFLNKKVFYIPILGPVYISNNFVQKLLSDILNNSHTNDFLPYDKNKRWYKNKTETILLEEIICNDKELYIPVKDTFKNVLKVFCYSNNFFDDVAISKIKKIYTKTKIVHKIDNLFCYCFKKPKTKIKFICQNIYLKNIVKKDNFAKFSNGVNYYNDLSNEVQLTFNDFRKGSELEGFGFLWEKFITKNKKLSPIICSVLKNKITGVIGPLDISKDVWNTPFLFPPYFGVAEKMRKTGIGEKLWKSAMSFAYQNGAQYTLVQNTPNSPAAQFYEKQGLSNEGKIYYYCLS
ncbi:GNAT family N-acetyltransferase [bacterium]|nr:GNAT family N-acetyltransferase [bacterium]